jgi:hypothetical protein
MFCIKCGNAATGAFTPDLDVKGIGYCDDHVEEIRLDLLVAQFDEKGWDRFEKKYFKKDGKRK